MNPLRTLADLHGALRAHPGRGVALVRPDGRLVPARFHVTEAGTVTKDFIDCGGRRRRRVTAQLQIWLGRDAAHRLTTDRLARILDGCAPVLPANDTPVEVEYEDGVVAQYPLTGLSVAGGHLELQLGWRHTECLARQHEPVAGEQPVPATACGCGDDCC